MRKQPLFLAAALTVGLAVLGCLSSCNDADYITESGADHRVYQLVNDTIQGVLNRIALAEENAKELTTAYKKADELAAEERQKLDSAYKAADSIAAARLADSISLLRSFAMVQAQQAQLAATEAARDLVGQARTELLTAIDETRDLLDNLNRATNDRVDSLASVTLALREANDILNQKIIAAHALANQAYQLAVRDSERIDSLANVFENSLADLTDEFHSIRDQLQIGIDTLMTQMQKAQADISTQQAQLDAHDLLLNGLQQTNEEFRQWLETLAAQDQQMASEIQDCRKDIEANLERISTLQTDLQDVRDSLEKCFAEAKGYTDLQIEAVRIIIQGNQERIDENSRLLEEAFGDIDALQAQLNANTNALNDRIDTLSENTNRRLTELQTKIEEAYQASDFHLQDQINDLNVRCDSTGTVIIDLQDEIKELYDNLQSKVEMIYDVIDYNVNHLITSIVYQGKNVKHLYARVTGTGNVVFKDGTTDTLVFPYATYPDVQQLTVGQLNLQKDAGVIYATINPSDIDATQTKLKLVNSLDSTSLVYSLDMEKATAANLRIVRQAPVRHAQSRNGLWAIPVVCIASDTLDEAAMVSDTEMRYALCATYNQKYSEKNDAYEKKVYSQYAIDLVPEKAVAATTLTLQGYGSNYEDTPAAGVDIQFRTADAQIRLGTAGTPVYRKFVECIQVRNSLGEEVTSAVETFNEALATFNDDTVDTYPLQHIWEASQDGSTDRIHFSFPASLKDLYVTLRYYVWNYDGTIVTHEAVIIYSENSSIPGISD